MDSINHEDEKKISNEKISNIKKMTLFLIEYSYILFAIYVIITIISVYIALHCNDVFSFETFTALVVPYIYLPLRYYFKDFCNMPTKMCFA